MNDKDLDDYIRGDPTSLWGHIGRMHKENFRGGSSSSSSLPTGGGRSHESPYGGGRSHQTPYREPVVKSKEQLAKEAGRTWALLGFIGVTLWALTQPDMTLGSAAVLGAIAAAFLYKFYKPILVVGLIAIAFQMFA